MKNENNGVTYYDTKTGRIINPELEEAFKNGVKSGDHLATGVGVQTRNNNNHTEKSMPSSRPFSLPDDNDPILRAVHENAAKYREWINAQQMASTIPTQPSQPKSSYPNNPSRERLYNEALNNSCPPEVTSVKRDRNNRRNVPKTVAALCLASIIAITSYLGIDRAVTNITDDIKLSQTSAAMSTLITGNSNAPDIVSMNTHRTKDYQNFWYDNYDIAKDICEYIPDQAFDAALYTTYIKMWPYATGNYVNNFDRVINACNQIATLEDNPIAYARCHDCLGFEDFAKKNGYVDENGLPSYAEYEKAGKEAINRYSQYLENCVNNRNTPTDVEYEDVSFGGRK